MARCGTRVALFIVTTFFMIPVMAQEETYESYSDVDTVDRPIAFPQYSYDIIVTIDEENEVEKNQEVSKWPKWIKTIFRPMIDKNNNEEQKWGGKWGKRIRNFFTSWSGGEAKYGKQRTYENATDTDGAPAKTKRMYLTPYQSEVPECQLRNKQTYWIMVDKGMSRLRTLLKKMILWG